MGMWECKNKSIKKMSGNLITHIQNKIKSLKDEVKSLEYTISEGFHIDKKRIEECIYKIQVLNEIIMSFGVQKK